jgi:hypothetical protein
MPDLPTFNPDYGRDNLRAWWETLPPNIAAWISKGASLLPGAAPPPATVAPPPAPATTAPEAAPQAVEPTPAAPTAPAAPAEDPRGPKWARVREYETQRAAARAAIEAAEAEIRKDPNSTAAYNAQRDLPAMRSLEKSITDSITAEENRLRDEAQKEKDKEEGRDAKPKNGDTRTIPWEEKLPNGQTMRGVKTEKYTNGTWSYVEGSSRAEAGARPEGTAQITNQVLTDGRGAYWTYDQRTGEVKPINGPAAGVKTVNGPDGSVYLQKPDGSLGERLFEGLPQTYTDDGIVVGVDRRTGQQVFRVDTKTPEGRALADRIARATAEAAERANEPKFASAVAQYQQEVTRRQGLARTELARLQDLQKSGQLSPDQAEAQFDRWMKTNVEGPLAGFRAAAEEERRKQEQENLTRQTAENARVEAANALRGRAGYEAGETAKAQALEVGLQTRSPEYIGQVGQFAQSLGQGKTNFVFDPSSLDPAKFKAVQPDYDAIANQAMQRLFGLYPEARAQNVNVGVPNLPTGQDLLGLMDGVKYSGPLTGAPAGETPLPGQEAIDLKNGKARTVYSNGRYVDWDINAPAPQLAQAGAGAATPALPGLGGPDVAGPPPPFTPPSVVQSTAPGALPGETEAERQARWKAIMAR